MQTEERQVITMEQQTPDQGWQQLQEIIGGIFDHVLRQEKENAILSASRMEAKSEPSGIPSPYRQTGEKRKIERRIVRLPLGTAGLPRYSASP
jgi:hypothetical protein